MEQSDWHLKLNNKLKIYDYIYLKNPRKKFLSNSFYKLLSKKYPHSNTIVGVGELFLLPHFYLCLGEMKKEIQRYY